MGWQSVAGERMMHPLHLALVSNVLQQYRAGQVERVTHMTAPDRPAAPRPGSLYHASSSSTPGDAQGIEELLRERLKLDDLLQQQFRRDITLLFTDIQDSTAYFERYGDLSGRQMVQRHNDLVGPLITGHQGTIVRSVQDTIMASYAEPTSAVQSAIAMQRALRDHNREREMAEQIHIRIGINAGPGPGGDPGRLLAMW